MSDRHSANSASPSSALASSVLPTQRSASDSGPLVCVLETALRTILKLPHDIPIAAHSPIELGLSSIGAITLQCKLQAAAGVGLSISEILGSRSVTALAALTHERQCAASAAAAHLVAVRQGGVLI